MKKRFYILSFITSLSYTIFAQTPSLEWAKSIGFSGTDNGKDIAVDSDGNVYTVGHFEGSIDADPGAAYTGLTSNGQADILITKLNAFGEFVWAKNIGAAINDAAYGIAITPSNELYITGYFQGTVDFNPSAATNSLASSNGSVDIFILKLDAAGNYLWAKSMGGWGTDVAYAIDTDQAGNVIIAGSFASTNADFNPSASVTNTFSAVGGADGFIAYYSANGDYTYAKSFGGASDDVVTALDYNVYDFSGYVNITGYFSGTADLDPTGTLNRTSNGGTDIFVSSFLIDGTFLSAQSFGGTLEDKGNGITTDSQGNIIYTGSFQSTVDFDPSTTVVSFTTNGLADAFVSKLDLNLAHVWTKRIGNATDDKAYSIAIDDQNNSYLIGNFKNTLDINPSGSSDYFIQSTSGGLDIFLVKLDQGGNFVWGSLYQLISGVLNTNLGNSIAVDANKNIYTTGSIQGGVDFDLINFINGTALYSSGLSDIFMAKIATGSTITIACPADSNIYMSQNPPVMPDLTSLASASTNCSLNNAVGITQNPIAGSTLVEGANIVTLSFLDDCGDAETCQVTVNYINDFSLTVQCPANQTTTDAICPDYTSLATVTNVCPSAGVVTTQTPAAGTNLALGATTITLETTNNCGLTSSCTFVVDRTLGINESNMTSLAVYPNPTKGFLTIESNRPTTLQLVSVQGQHLRSVQIDAKTTIDITNLSPGVYLLIGEGNNPIRFIKE